VTSLAPRERFAFARSRLGRVLSRTTRRALRVIAIVSDEPVARRFERDRGSACPSSARQHVPTAQHHNCNSGQLH